MSSNASVKLKTNKSTRLFCVRFKRRAWITNGYWLTEVARVAEIKNAPAGEWVRIGVFSKISARMRMEVLTLLKAAKRKSKAPLKNIHWIYCTHGSAIRLGLWTTPKFAVGINSDYAAAFADCELWADGPRAPIQAWKDGQFEGLIMPMRLEGDEAITLEFSKLGAMQKKARSA